ncbi:MAG: M3 family oligoendopeptidase [Acidobacteria bacterium]|nr:M3 family oligoendopeptidase [Acidobacteriota bacterium]
MTQPSPDTSIPPTSGAVPSPQPVWDLSGLYRSPDDPALARDMETLEPLAEAFERKFRGTLDAAGTVLRAIACYEEIQALLSRVRAYAHLAFAVRTDDPTLQKLLVKTDLLEARLEEKLVFFRLELMERGGPALDAFIDDPRLAGYRTFLRHLRAFAPHRLSEPEEVVTARKDVTGRLAFTRLYEELTASFVFGAEVRGEARVRTGSEMRALFYDPDPDVRRQAVEAYYGRYGEHGAVITTVFNSLAQDHALECGTRRWGDPLAPSLADNLLERSTLDRMRGVIAGAYGLVGEYYRLKAGLLGVERLTGADLYAPVGDPAPLCDFPSAERLTREAYGRFHPEAGRLAGLFFDERLIHAPVAKGKQGGAFCYGPGPSCRPYILLNHTGQLRDVFTLAHELGHGIHDLLASGRSWLNYHPPLVAAETASVFGEMLLTERLLETPMTPGQRVGFLCGRLEDAIATLFRQNMYIDFEWDTHTRIAGEILSADELCAAWETRARDLYGGVVDFLPEQRWNWAAIPHFFRYTFYCYAYSFGQLFVWCLFRKWKEEGGAFAGKFMDLLAAGGSRTPAELAGSVGEDLDSPAFWEKGLSVFRGYLDELSALVPRT